MKKFGKRSLVLVAAFFLVAAGGCVLSIPKSKPLQLGAAPEKPERTPIYHCQGWTIARASMHNHTIFSDGRYTPEDLLELARRQGIAILGYNDHREGKICVGGLCVNAGGVESIGYDKYYERLAGIQKRAGEQDMIVTRGVEVSSPYFYNYGKFPNLVLAGQYQHFTVYDVQDPKVLAEMPARRNLESLKPEPFPGDTPLQKFVDYIADHGGIVNAVHVEEGQDEWMGPVHVWTPSPIYNIHLQHLNSFSVLPAAWHEKTGGPGGLWDTANAEYLAGMKPRPLWGMGDADFHRPPESLAWATTLFYMREFTEAEVYRCLREGRMVALQGEAFQNSYVAEWRVSDSAPPSNPIMLGEQVVLKGAPTVRFALDHPVAGTKVRLVRNGVVVLEKDGSELTYTDNDLGARKEPAFYRVEVIGPIAASPGPTMRESELFVNPIFVRFAR